MSLRTGLYTDAMSSGEWSDSGASTRVQAQLFDAVLGVAVFGTVAGMIAADVDGDRAPEPLAYLWALALGTLMLVRRRWPLAILFLTIVGLWSYYAADYPVIGLSVPAAAALYSAAEFRKLRWSVSAALFLLVGSYFYRLVVAGQDVSRIIGYELSGHVALMSAAIALGVSMRLRRELQESSRRLVEATAHHERIQARAAVTAERTDIARELHDSLGHRTTVICMHADVAREALSQRPEAAQEALEVIRSTSGEMMGELQATVEMLRRRRVPRAPESLSELREQVFERLPLRVRAEIEIGEGSLPRPVRSAVYRIVQEALTNVVKHSKAESAEVFICRTGGNVEVLVRDPGPARQPRDETETGREGPPEGGFGLYGMAERAASAGGRLTARAAGAGFEVRVDLPAVSGSDSSWTDLSGQEKR